MPKSKRNKIVHLTQVKKKTKDHKDDLMKQLEGYMAQFSKVYLFNFDQTKSDRILALRVKLKSSGRIYAGRNSILLKTLKTIGSKTKTNYEDLASQVVGHRGFLFTDINKEQLMEFLDKECPEFCKKFLGYSETKLNQDKDGTKQNIQFHPR